MATEKQRSREAENDDKTRVVATERHKKKCIKIENDFKVYRNQVDDALFNDEIGEFVQMKAEQWILEVSIVC